MVRIVSCHKLSVAAVWERRGYPNTMTFVSISSNNTKQVVYCLLLVATSSIFCCISHAYAFHVSKNYRRVSSSTIGIGISRSTIRSIPYTNVGIVRTSSSSLCYYAYSFHPADIALSFPSPLLLAEVVESATTSAATWKQYVSLGVILMVVVDIILGSPLLNMVTAPLKRRIIASEEDGDDPLNTTPNMVGRTPKQQWIDKSKERVDTETIAKEALDKANNAIALRDYLNRNKTDKDRMEELQREIDRKLLGE